MEKRFFLKRLFVPLALLLALMNVVAVMSGQLGNLIQASEFLRGQNFEAFHPTAQLAGIIIFSILIFLVRKLDFRKIFYSSLFLVAALLIISMYIPPSNISYLLAGGLCPQLILLMGWAYINQIAKWDEGVKYFFALNFVVGILLTPFSFMKPTGNFIPLLGASLCALALVWLCDRWTQARLTEEKRSDAAAPSKPTFPILTLGFILTGFNLVYLLVSQEFKRAVVLMHPTGAEYTSLMGKFTMISGVGVLLLTIASIFIGPKLIRSKGWRFSVISAVVLVFIGTAIALLQISPFSFILDMSLLKGFQYAWIFPLVQIAFLIFSRQARFYIQAAAVLVIAPLFELANYFFVIVATAVPIWGFVLPLVILVAMALCAILVAKRNRSLLL